jgi:hypothetical protein
MQNYKTLDCICGKLITLDFMGKNFEKHIKTDPQHLKYIYKLWKIKQKQKKKQEEKTCSVIPVECVKQNNNF